MTTVTIGVASLSDTRRRLSAAFRGKKQGARISLPKRWALLKLMAGKGAMAIREIARRAQRDVRAVHSDVHVLLRAGVLEKAEDGGVVFPYDAIHVDFLLKAAWVAPAAANGCSIIRCPASLADRHAPPALGDPKVRRQPFLGHFRAVPGGSLPTATRCRTPARALHHNY
jgi:predicted transcriptional regulator